jgi:hypothetical protein
MTITDNDLSELLNRLSPRDRRLISDALRGGGQLTKDVRAILRWLRRRLKSKARGRRRRTY